MLKQFFKIAGVKNEKEFLNKYPTEESFFRQHPEALRLLEQSSPFMPSYGEMTMPQAMYGMGMAYGGSYLPMAQAGIQVPPKQEDYPDYESFNEATMNYITSLQQQADNPAPAAIQAQNQAMAGAPTMAANPPKLNPYKGISIVEFLMAQGKPSDFSSRKQLASSLGIANYRGTASQNSQMLQLLQGAPDALSSYQGVNQPTANVTKKAAAGKNASAAPTTEELAAAKFDATSADNLVNRRNYRKARLSEDENLVNRRNYRKARLPKYDNALPFDDEQAENFKATKNPITGVWTAVVPPEGIMSPEYGQRKILANQLNTQDALRKSGQPMIGPARGYEYGGGYTGTWNGNQGFDMGGAYVPDYSSNVYSLPKFGLGNNMYQDGGMTQPQAQFDQQQLIQMIFQMLQQGAAPEQILQQLAQSGVPQEMAQQLIQMVMQQVQGGGMEGGQEGTGGGQPNGFDPSMQAAAPQEQGMEGMPAMAYGGLPKAQRSFEVTKDTMGDFRNANPQAIGLDKFMKNSFVGEYADKTASELSKMMTQERMKRDRENVYKRNLEMINRTNPYFQMTPQGSMLNKNFADGGTSYAPGQEMEVDQDSLDELRRNGINFEIID